MEMLVQGKFGILLLFQDGCKKQKSKHTYKRFRIFKEVGIKKYYLAFKLLYN